MTIGRVVSNSTPLIALSKIGQFAILKKYFSEINIPKAVYNEIVNSRHPLDGSEKWGTKS